MSKPPECATTFFKNLRSILVGHFGLQSLSYRVKTPWRFPFTDCQNGIQFKSKKRLQTLRAYMEGLLHIVDSVKICFLQLLLFNSCCEWKQFICLCGKWWKPTVFVHNYAAYTIVIWVYLKNCSMILKLHIKYVKKWNMKSGEN